MRKFIPLLFCLFIGMFAQAQTKAYLFNNGTLINNANPGTADLIQTGSSSVNTTSQELLLNNAKSLNGDYFDAGGKLVGSHVPHNSITFWIKTNTLDANERMIISNYNYTDVRGIKCWLQNGKIYFGGNHSGASIPFDNVVSNSIVADGNWHHVTLDLFINTGIGGGGTVIIGNYEYRLYIDGISAANPVANWGTVFVNGNPPLFDANTSMMIGIDNDLTGLQYEDEIDDIKVWRTDLSVAQIAELAAGNNCDVSNVALNVLTNTAIEVSVDLNPNTISWDLTYVLAGQPVANGTTINGITANSEVLTGLNANTAYDIYVRTTCSGGTGAYLDEVSATTLESILFVDQDASGLNDGSSWANAFNDLQDALPLGTASKPIWAAEGTYIPGATNKSTFEILNGTKVYGGFDGTEVFPTQRDPKANITILSGDLNGDDNTILIETEPTRADNAYHVVSIRGNAQDVVLDGFTVSGGNANGIVSANCNTSASQQFIDSRGAAIYANPIAITQRLKAKIVNCILEKNTAQSTAVYTAFTPCGVQNIQSDVDFENCIIRDNYSATLSAMLFSGSNGYLIYGRGSIVNCLFYNNVSPARASCIVLSTSTAFGNISGMSGNPNGIDIDITNSTFANNSGLNGNVIDFTRARYTRVNNNIFHNNGSTTPFVITSTPPTISTSIVEGGQLGGIDADPFFADAANGDFNLLSTSGAINLGANNALPSRFTVDLAGKPRIFDDVIDAGAYEAQTPACLKPYDVEATNITTTSALITWNAEANVNEFELLYVEAGQPISAGTIISNITTSSQTITGLISETSYEVYVSGTCNGTDFTNFSTVETFTTQIGPIYVDIDATGNNDGSSWANAFTDIQSALPLANAAKEIWVAEGTYIPGNSRNSTFSLRTNTTIYGGFNGTESGSFQRDPKVNLTILSGDVNGNDNTTLVDTEPTRQDNVYHVVTMKGDVRDIVIDGFVISDGNSNGAQNNSCNTAPINQSYNSRGGAIYVNPYLSAHFISATINNCVIEKNTGTRASVYATFTPCGVTGPDSDIDFTNCIIRQNYSDLEGLMTFSGSNGYGLEFRGSVVNCLFYKNISNTRESCISLSTGTANGGNVNALDFDLINTTFANNTGNNGIVIRLINAVKARIHNVIIYENGSGTPFSVGSTAPTFNTSIVEGGQYGGMNVDPLFIDAANDNYTPSCASPAIDAANAAAYSDIPAVDVLGNPRTNGVLDMGAIEFQGAVSSTNTNVSVSVCFGDNYTFPDGSIQNIGLPVTQTSNLQSSTGCDSTIVTTVSVIQSYNVANGVAICAGDDYTFADGTIQTNITSDVTYVSNLQTTEGCDSNVTTIVEVTTVSNQTENITVCTGENYTFPDGSVQTNITSQVVYTSNMQSVAGCDSIIVTTLFVSPAFNTTQNVTVCTGASYTFPDGTTQTNITSAVSQISNLLTTTGCDSVIETSITVTNAYTIPVAVSICSGDSYSFADGTTQTNITADVVQTSTLQSTIGCDSNIVTTITVNPEYFSSVNADICIGSSYTFPDGTTTSNITVNGFYISLLQTAEGCDSTIRTNFTVYPAYNLIVSEAVCIGDDYTFPDGSTQTNLQADVTYTSSLQTADGCDSTIVTTVVVNPEYNATQNVTVCTGAAYTFPDGSTQTNITSAINQTSNLQTAAGCDSIIVTSITVTNAYTIPVAVSICSGDNYSFADGSTQTNITADLVQTSTLMSSIGCDSNIVTTITVNPVYNSSNSVVICSGDNYTFPDGSSQTNIMATLTQTSSLQTAAGCDSIIVTSVVVNPSYSLSASAAVCIGGSYTFPDGSTQTNLQADVTYTSSLQTTAGCDSTIVTTVTVSPEYALTQNVDVCAGSSYTFPDGSTQTNITTATNQTSNLQTSAGCDSIVTTNIAIITSFAVNSNATICSGENYTFADGSTQTNITNQVVYVSNIQSANGCDSVITTTVDVLPTYSQNTSALVCFGESYTFADGSTENNIQLGFVYTSTLQTTAGCDSLIVTAITVAPIFTQTLTAAICEGDNYTFPDGSSQVITSTATQVSTFQSSLGCDSVVTTIVNVLPVYNLTAMASICTGQSYTFPDGTTQNNITAGVTYTSNLQTAAGCDSVITTIVDVFSAYNVSTTASVCSGGSYTFADGTIQNNITATVIYTSNLTTNTGCDSIIETTLTVNPNYASNQFADVCSGGSYTFPDGSSQSNITADVIYTSTLQTFNGCDSTVTTNLTVLAAYATTEEVNICRGGSYTFPDGTTQTSISGQVTYTSQFQAANGCDSTITTTVKVKDVNPTTIFDGQFITPVQTGTSYQWLDCNNNYTPISGATDYAFEPQANGSYAVEIDQDGCVAIVGCINILLTGLFDNASIEVNVYPNPTTDYLTIEVAERIEEIKVYDANGSLMKLIQEDVRRIDVANLAQGMYFLEIRTQNAFGSTSFMKK